MHEDADDIHSACLSQGVVRAAGALSTGDMESIMSMELPLEPLLPNVTVITNWPLMPALGLNTVPETPSRLSRIEKSQSISCNRTDLETGSKLKLL